MTSKKPKELFHQTLNEVVGKQKPCPDCIKAEKKCPSSKNWQTCCFKCLKERTSKLKSKNK